MKSRRSLSNDGLRLFLRMTDHANPMNPPLHFGNGHDSILCESVASIGGRSGTNFGVSTRRLQVRQPAITFG
jgi:hypothetical protein